MQADYEIKVMLLTKPRYNIRTKCEEDAPITLTPTTNIFIRIRPKEVTEKAIIRTLE
jgi:hypothetical protein